MPRLTTSEQERHQELERFWDENLRVYGVCKVCKPLRREGVNVGALRGRAAHALDVPRPLPFFAVLR